MVLKTISPGCGVRASLMLFLKSYDFNLFLKQVSVLALGPHQANHSKLWEHQKQNCGQSVFFIYVQMDRIKEPPRTFDHGRRNLVLYLPQQVDKREPK